MARTSNFSLKIVICLFSGTIISESVAFLIYLVGSFIFGASNFARFLDIIMILTIFFTSFLITKFCKLRGISFGLLLGLIVGLLNVLLSFTLSFHGHFWQNPSYWLSDPFFMKVQIISVLISLFFVIAGVMGGSVAGKFHKYKG